MTTFDAFHGGVVMLHHRLRNASMRNSLTPARVRAWEREALPLTDGFSSTWLTYPMRVEGRYPECTTAETAYLRRHYRAMTELYAVKASRMPGEHAMTREEYTTRLRALKMHLGGGSSRDLAYVYKELSALGQRSSPSKAAAPSLPQW